MNDQDEAFVARLTGGPGFLLLGQRYLALESGLDAFLSEALRKFGGAGAEELSYNEILKGSAGASVQPSLAWMDERCRRLSVPEWLKLVARYPWNAVYTSAIDSIWPNTFRSSWRDVQPLFEEKYKPSDPRNRLLLHCTFLFGSVNRTEEGERPPLTRFEWRKRRQIAVALARRLPEEVTPLGTLAIEGYVGEADWLSPEDLFPIIDEFNPGQVHLFSALPGMAEHPDWTELATAGKLTLHSSSLAAVLSEGEALGILELGQRPEEAEAGRRLGLQEKTLAIPRDLWNQVSRSAIVLDDSVIAPPSPLSDDARYQEFRSFLSAMDAKPRWSAYARGFAFHREFEIGLRDIVTEALAKRRLTDEPIILHGAPATGKTVALEALAYTIRTELRFPVLFIERRTQKPLPSDIDQFCQWAEDSGAPACLVVWDGMVSPQDYFDFLAYLTGRGRKVALVGSCYRIHGARSKEPKVVEASGLLSRSELEGFARFLQGFHPSFGEVVTLRDVPPDYTFLVALYRLLPPTRSPIRVGVTKEIGHAEEVLARRAKEAPSPAEGSTILAQALVAAGLVAPERLLTGETRDVGDERVTDVQDLTGLVMVPGRFGLRVPLELLVRALGRDGFSRFADLFEGIDAFQWLEDSIGNIEIGPRSSLEARLIVQARMGGPRTEVAYAQRLLLDVKEAGSPTVEDREITFAVELVRAMGAQGQERTYFDSFFKDLAGTLRQLREERGVRNPRLMLQEANLLREWSVEQSKRREEAPDLAQEDDVDDALSEAQAVLREALDFLADDRPNRPLRSHLVVELATAEATRARRLVAAHGRSEDAVSSFNAARSIISEAQLQDPTSFYPVDVLTWSTMAMLRSATLDEEEGAEATADLLYAFQIAESSELEPDEEERFQGRRLEFAQFLGDQAMAEDAFAALEARGSSAGYFLRATKMSGLPETAKRMAATDVMKLKDALHYLEANRERLSTDSRCLDLLLELWWRVHCGRKPFDGERLTLPLSEVEWRELLSIILSLEAAGLSHRPLTVAFLHGLALFHVGHVGETLEVFRELERESDRVRGRHRIIRTYLASTPSGEPRTYHGTVSWIAANRARGGVYVEELRNNIVFIPRDFRPDLTSGDSLPEFHVAFNFLGPIADPKALHAR